MHRLLQEQCRALELLHLEDNNFPTCVEKVAKIQDIDCMCVRKVPYTKVELAQAQTNMLDKPICLLYFVVASPPKAIS